MKHLPIIAAGGLAALLLAGCSGMEVGRASKLSASGDGFDQSLYKGYIDLAKSEFAEGDYEDSDQFAMRASTAAGGTPVAPEQIDARKLPKDKVGDLSGARKRLVASLVAGAREKAPASAANAQVMFDCWMQEQEENFQPEDIAACRGGFMQAMAQVDGAMKTAPAPKPMAQGPTKRSFVVYFPFDSDKITPASKQAILTAIDEAKKMGAKRIAVMGHADTAGANRYNAKLASMRTNAVAKELSAGGLSEKALNLGSFGEALPAVKTGDGVRAQQNRRVVIEISK